eukprot:gnl/MRDRNA2_/MRDRNA2_116192_c0_seq1.p1 gnl/MRDRNA2_/MRDRNA2_116192_c0~~gnl/MRDRNA2_/MRDRNA2_116192_c0_seq1.p1  ORF type:complete len:207 (-),score=34.92 gnl/MRDRNA2_/MRDRNA2_116192_c0_seq1:8-628(-)
MVSEEKGPLDLGAGNLVYAEFLSRELQLKNESKKGAKARKAAVYENPFEGFYYGKGRHHPRNNKSYEVSSTVSPGPMYFFDWRPGISKWTARHDVAAAMTAPPAYNQASSERSLRATPPNEDALRLKLQPLVRQEVLKQLSLHDSHQDAIDKLNSTMHRHLQPNSSIFKKSIWCLSPKNAMTRSAPQIFRPKDAFRRCWLENEHHY